MSSWVTQTVRETEKKSIFLVEIFFFFFLYILPTLILRQSMLEMTKYYWKPYFTILCTHLLYAVTTERAQVARALRLGAPVASVMRLPIAFAWALSTAHQSTIAVWEWCPWRVCSTAQWCYFALGGDQHLQGTGHVKDYYWRNSPEMCHGA